MSWRAKAAWALGTWPGFSWLKPHTSAWQLGADWSNGALLLHGYIYASSHGQSWIWLEITKICIMQLSIDLCWMNSDRSEFSSEFSTFWSIVLSGKECKGNLSHTHTKHRFPVSSGFFFQISWHVLSSPKNATGRDITYLRKAFLLLGTWLITFQ